jgi:hypothetical protein
MVDYRKKGMPYFIRLPKKRVFDSLLIEAGLQHEKSIKNVHDILESHAQKDEST